MIIDRFEGDWAIIEYDAQFFKLPKSLLPPDAEEGDMLELHITINESATAERKNKIQELMDDLFE